jgi:hypothetical protein
MGEPLAWHGNGQGVGRQLAVNLSLCALLAVATPGIDILVHTHPHYPGGHESPGGPHAWVGEAMHSFKQLPEV